MNEEREYRGAIITIPANGDGAWRWAAYFRKGKRTLGISEDVPRPTFKTRDAAIAVAKLAIDAFFARSALQKPQEMMPKANVKKSARDVALRIPPDM